MRRLQAGVSGTAELYLSSSGDLHYVFFKDAWKIHQGEGFPGNQAMCAVSIKA